MCVCCQTVKSCRWPDVSLEPKVERGARTSNFENLQHVGGTGAVRMGILTWDLGVGRKSTGRARAHPLRALREASTCNLSLREEPEMDSEGDTGEF